MPGRHVAVFLVLLAGGLWAAGPRIAENGVAKAAIVVLGDSRKTDLWEVNCAISATFLQLSAVEHGLGSCWVHIAGRQRSKDGSIPGNAEDYVRKLLGIEENMRILCLIALGYEAPVA